MAKEARVSLQQFIAALENHFNAVTNRRGDSDTNAERSYEVLEAAFLDYEEALADTYDEYLPFVQAEDID